MARTHPRGGGGRGGGGAGGRREPSRAVAVSKALSFILRHAAEREGVSIDSQGYANVGELLRWKKLKALDVSFAEVVAAVSSSDKQRFGLLYAPPAGGAGAAAAPQADPAARAPQSQTPPETSARLPTTEDQQQQQQQQPVVSDDATAQAIAASAHDPDPHHYLIRARQGHSIKTVDASSLLRPLSAAANDDDRLLLPPTVVHGTYHAAWPQILHAGGLKCMGRNHVHFATGPPLSAVLPNGTAGEVVVPARLKSGGRRGGNTGDEGGGHQEVISGMRFDSQILIYIDVKKALAAGCPFWISENGVVLSEGMDSGSSGQQQQQQQQSQKLVGTEFFDVVVELRNGLGVIWENGALAPHVPDWMRAAPGPAPAGHGRARGKGRGRGRGGGGGERQARHGARVAGPRTSAERATDAAVVEVAEGEDRI